MCGVPVECVRFWSFYRRQNNTIRPEKPISDEMDGHKLENVFYTFCKTYQDLRLFMEVAKQHSTDGSGKVVNFPSETDHITMFIKFYDPAIQRLEYLGSIHVKPILKGTDLVPILNQLKGLPANTALKIFEEIKPGMVELLKLKNNLKASELTSGDILCFQVDNAREYVHPILIVTTDHLTVVNPSLNSQMRPNTIHSF
jgi:ubiquitin carboxyl-terminal hydrolase 7